MRKNLIYAGMLLLGMTVATSCSNEETLEQVQGNGTLIQAVIENALEARTSVNDTYQVEWTTGDAFDVWNNGSKLGSLELKSGDGTTSGSFGLPTDATEFEVPSGATAFFPSNSGDAQTYTFATEYTSQETDAPMLGSYNGSKFSFNLLTAMVRVVVADVPAGNAVLTITSEDMTLTGEAALNNGTLAVPTSGMKEVTVKVTTTAASTLTFDVPVPAQAYTNGLSVKLTVGNTEVFSKKTNGFTGEVGKIYVFGTSVISDANALKAAFENGGEYVLSANVTLDEAKTLAADKTLTIDLNGKTLTLSSTSATNPSDDIVNNGTLTIKNGTISSANTAIASSGTLTLLDCTVSTSDNRVNAVCATGGTMTIEGGSYTNTAAVAPNDAVYVIGVIGGSTATIKDVTVSSSNQGGITVYGNSSATINGGSYTAGNWHALYVSTSTVNYNGAKFDATSNSWSDIFVKEGSTINGQAYTGTTNINAVSSSEDLASAITNGGNVTLADDVTLTSTSSLTIAQDKKVSIDLNGKTLNLSSTSADTPSDDIVNNGTLTIKNGTISSANTAIASSGTLTLLDCTVSTNDNRVNAVCATGGTMTIEGGSYTNTATTAPDNAVYVIGVINGATATIKDVTVSSSNQGGITVYGNSSATINGGSYTAGNWHALYVSTSTITYDTDATFSATSTGWSDIFIKAETDKSSTVNSQTYTTNTSINQN